MGARERPGGGVAESGPGNPAKCLDFFAAPRTRQCALLLRRGRTCSLCLNRTEPGRAEPRSAVARGTQHLRHHSLCARIPYLHRNSVPCSRVPSVDRSCSKGKLAGAARVPTGGVKQKARGTPGSGGQRHPGSGWRAGSGGRCERAGGGPRRAPPPGRARRSACAEPLRGLSVAQAAVARTREQRENSDVRLRALLAVAAWRLGSSFWTRSARWQRLARCFDWLDPVVNYRAFGRRCHRCCLRHISLQQGKPGRKGLRPSLYVVGTSCQEGT